jgi:DNA-binding transcriptional LysR family regulator
LGTISAAKFRILEGKGVGVLPLYFVQPELKARKLKRVFSDTEPLVDMFRLVWKTGHPMTPEIRNLGQALATIALK